VDMGSRRTVPTPAVVATSCLWPPPLLTQRTARSVWSAPACRRFSSDQNLPALLHNKEMANDQSVICLVAEFSCRALESKPKRKSGSKLRALFRPAGLREARCRGEDHVRPLFPSVRAVAAVNPNRARCSTDPNRPSIPRSRTVHQEHASPILAPA
jgi:hypothetical protein